MLENKNPEEMTLSEALKTISEATEIINRIGSLKQEYDAYHTDTDYWRGIKYALDCISKEH